MKYFHLTHLTILGIIILFISCNTQQQKTIIWAELPTTKAEDLQIRDPFIITDFDNQRYYMYRSIAIDRSPDYDKLIGGVEVFMSTDLKNWTGPQTVMTLPHDNWAKGKIWAPEVHKYNGKYYMFATINSKIKWKQSASNRYTFRGTQIFYSDSPEGPFEAFGTVPHTPIDEMALDGTFWEEDGFPYMIYCHEWLQVRDGEIKLLRLKKDLSEPDGNPVRLFCASAAPWSNSESEDYVTDGPFIYKTQNGKLLMLWSSFMNNHYAIGVAESVTGKILGPWKQREEPLYSNDGGHGMIFKSLEGKLFLVIHSPNYGLLERATFIEIEDTGDDIVLKH